MPNFTDVAKVRQQLLELEERFNDPDWTPGNVIATIDAALASPPDKESQLTWLAQIMRITGLGELLGAEQAAELLYQHGVRVFDRDDVVIPPEPEATDGQP